MLLFEKHIGEKKMLFEIKVECLECDGTGEWNIQPMNPDSVTYDCEFCNDGFHTITEDYNDISELRDDYPKQDFQKL